MTVKLDLHELGAVGPALVVDLKPCPAIPAGPGQVITATFKHANADVMDLVLSHSPISRTDAAPIPNVSSPSPATLQASPATPDFSQHETIGVTGNHPFWSLDRAELVQVGELAIGERLQTLGGDIRWVQQKLPRPGPEPVYNLEVHGEHVYYVGTSGVLAHNAGCGPNGPKGPLWTSTNGKTGIENAYGHWIKHGKEFPEFQTAMQYVRAARAFVTNPPAGVLTKVRANGDRSFYDTVTNTFLSQRSDGAIRTMFRPINGINYWNLQ